MRRMLSEMTSMEITEWRAYAAYEAGEGQRRPNTDTVPDTMTAAVATPSPWVGGRGSVSDVVYDEPIPDDVFE